MKITFETKIEADKYGGPDKETHKIFLNQEFFLSANDFMEPEDVRFYRDLKSPFECEKLILEAYEAGRRGDYLCIEHIRTEHKEKIYDK